MPCVLITGASSGIGYSLAKHYFDQGWQVIACGRNSAKLALLEESCLAASCAISFDNNSSTGCVQGKIHQLSFDITNKQQVLSAGEQLKQLIADENLSLTQVVLNAGSCEYIDDVSRFDSDLFARVINTNVVATGFCLEAFLPLLVEDGRIALMSSSAIYLPFPRAQAYGASKAAVTYLAESLRVDLQASKRHVSVIHPGFVQTPLTDKNDFSMPMRISSEQAASYIYQGMKVGRNDIHFPRRFTYMLKLLGMLPTFIKLKLLGADANNKSSRSKQDSGPKLTSNSKSSATKRVKQV
ncbi:SDR family NAD(P)-dependent oxidoreductase [Shewanella sp. WXL01]|uniref:SDR family NAD(P)-dependent oxidoreductase n=1 Tax=Shewanella sp. WXL01 TaxID=2709721 RepID=UPI0014383A46|nr:SDR family NAD(P)-dependent oxidoreductase [Shewanella sp. WXL01]NKF49818.1 SDR family NAD(P)-dependent oxidoreductase [Shewanella sp. WXL01]